MTVDAYERSVEDAAPVDLLVFTLYDQTYRYTTASATMQLDGQDYEPATLRVPEISQSQDFARASIEIECAADFPILAMFDAAPPSDVLELSILRMHRPDTVAATFWAGRVVSVEYRGSAAVLTGQSIYTSLARRGVRFRFSRNCQHAHYGARCGVDGAAFRVEAMIDSVAGSVMVINALAAEPAGRFAGGFVEWIATPGRTERRAIKRHDAGELTLTHAIAGLAGGDTVRVYPGCQHNAADCNDFYGNILNYGGFKDVPKKNPFGSSSVF